jgi:hypothetical protein
MIFNGIMACGRLNWMKSLQLIEKVILLKRNTYIILARHGVHTSFFLLETFEEFVETINYQI